MRSLNNTRRNFILLTCFLLLGASFSGAQEGKKATATFHSKYGSIDVLWRTESGSEVLQVAFTPKIPNDKEPAAQIWLLKADGSTLPCGKPDWTHLSTTGTIVHILMYTLPEGAKSQVPAIAVKVGDEYFATGL